MPTRPSRKKVDNINIQRLSEQHLLDSKLLRPKGPDFKSVGLLAIALGILLAGGFFGYYYFSKSPAEPATTPEIIVPEGGPETLPPEEDTSTPPITTPSVKLQEVEILETPTGYLNVRKGPGTNFEKIAQVKPGESYPLVSEDQTAGWYKIKLSESSTGWVTKQYAKKTE